MIEIYHNPRCTKSRQGVQLLQERKIDFKEIRYLDTGLSKKDLKTIVNKLGIAPIELVRKNEVIWKSDYKGTSLSDEEIIEAIVSHPKLMERPVVINGDKAVIGRPTELINNII